MGSNPVRDALGLLTDGLRRRRDTDAAGDSDVQAAGTPALWIGGHPADAVPAGLIDSAIGRS